MMIGSEGEIRSQRIVMLEMIKASVITMVAALAVTRLIFMEAISIRTIAPL